MTTIKEAQKMTVKELNEHLFYHWDTLGKAQKEVNRRLTNEEEAVKKIAELEKIRDEQFEQSRALALLYNQQVAQIAELEKEVERLKATAVYIYCNKIMVAENGKDKLSMMIDHMSLCEKHPVYKIGNLLVEIERLKADKRELVEALEAIRKVVVVACGDKAPYIKIALNLLERLDAALAKCPEGHDTRHFYSWLDEIKRLLDKVESLQCCGNCMYSCDCCPQKKEQELEAFNCCEHWQSDDLTAEERIKG
jgi:uncharacterized small protein (DUF1192 family)